MKKIILFSLLLICLCQGNSFAQQNTTTPTTVHEYYVMVRGLNTVNDEVSFKSLIGRQEGVISIISKGSPVKFFIVTATRVISMQDVRDWISTSTYELKFVTDDPKAKMKLDKM